MAREIKASQLKAVTVVATLLVVFTMIGGAWTGYRALKLFDAVETNWSRFDTVSEQKINYLTRLHAALGYGGLTRHVQDWVLYGDEKARATIETDLDAAKISIQSYMLLNIDDGEKLALVTLNDLVNRIDSRLATVPEMMAQGWSPRQIDEFLHLEDIEAVSALTQLRWSWRAQAKTVGKELTMATTDGAALIGVGAVLVPVMLLIGLLVIWLIRQLSRQISAYHLEKRALEASERRFKDLAANVPGVVFQWYERANGEHGYRYVSPRCADLYGVDPAAVRKDWRALRLEPSDEERWIKTVREAAAHQSEWSFEGRFVGEGDQQKWWRGVAKPVVVGADEVVFNGVMIDITLQKSLEAELRALATSDPLTGAANRRHYLEVAAREIERAKRYRLPLCVLMLDIDHFKKVNDTYGHAGGDAALKHFVGLIWSCLRDSDLLGRMGGEEFAILLPETDITGAVAFAERIRVAVETMPVEWDGDDFLYTVSIGAAAWSPSDKTVECAMHRADEALYRAKAGGRNRVEVAPGVFPHGDGCASEAPDLSGFDDVDAVPVPVDGGN